MAGSGWGFPMNSRKAHFFVDGRSLCGRWFFVGEPSNTQETWDKPAPDDCRECWRKAKKLEAADA